MHPRIRSCLSGSLLLVSLLAATCALARPTSTDAAQEARRSAEVRRILRETPLVDGHNDLAEQLRDRVRNHLDSLDLAHDTGHLVPPMQTDIPRLRQGGVGGTFFAAFVPADLAGPAAVRFMFEQIDVLRRLPERYPADLALACSAADVRRIHRSGRIAVLIGVEGGHAIGNSLAVLRQAYQCGARYLTLTHVKTNDWADAALWHGVGEDTLRHGGLTRFGREVIREMNRLGMLVDLSHAAEPTMLAALEVSEAPVIFSHSSARALCDHPRDVPDDVLHRLAANGGIVMVSFGPGFTSEEYRAWDNGLAIPEWRRLETLYPGDDGRVAAEFAAWKKRHPSPPVPLARVADHIDHVRQVAGIDHVGIGTDFDGMDEFPVGLEDTSRFPALLAELRRRGYTANEVGKVAGGNILRVMREAERVAQRLQKARQPSDALIEDLDAP